MWVQKKIVEFWHSTQNTRLRPTEFFWEFLVTLPAISSEAWEKYFWAFSGSIAFRDWLFLLFLRVSFETTASFFLFLKVAMILRENFWQQWRLNWSSLIYNPEWWCLLIMREKSFNKCKRLMILKGTIPEGYSFYILDSTFISSIYIFPWRKT